MNVNQDFLRGPHPVKSRKQRQISLLATVFLNFDYVQKIKCNVMWERRNEESVVINARKSCVIISMITIIYVNVLKSSEDTIFVTLYLVV